MNLSIDTSHIQLFGVTLEQLCVLEYIHTHLSYLEEGEADPLQIGMQKALGLHTNKINPIIQQLVDQSLLVETDSGIVKTSSVYRNLILNPEPKKNETKKEKAERKLSKVARIEGYQFWVDTWNDAYKTNYQMNRKKKQQILARRKKFSAKEIMMALKARHNDRWLRTTGSEYRPNWNTFWRSDEKVERYLLKAKQQTETDKPNSNSYISETI